MIWAYDYGARTKRRWPAKHDNILVYVKDPAGYWFDAEAVERIPYMAPGLVGPEKAARGKLPTDTWWQTIVPPGGAERTGYPTQKPVAILRRIVSASCPPGGWSPTSSRVAGRRAPRRWSWAGASCWSTRTRRRWRSWRGGWGAGRGGRRR